MAVINASYDEIEQWIDNGTIQDHVAINDTINISYYTYTMPFEVTGFEPTACQIDGEEVIRPALNLFFYYTTPVTVSYGTSGTVKYSESSLRNYINGTLMGQLDQDFVAHLASTKVQTYSRDGSTDVVYDKLFAPSMAELGVTNTSYNNAQQAAVEGPAFVAYQEATNAKRLKQAINATGTAQYYWTRSLYSGNSDLFGRIGTSGAPNGNYYNGSQHVVVACNFIGTSVTPNTSVVDNVLVPYNGSAVIPKNIIVPHNGLAKSAIKCYASKDGIAKLVYPVEPEEPTLAYIELEVTSGSGTVHLYNRWSVPVEVDVKHIDGTISRAQLAGSPASSSTSSYTNYIDQTVSTGDIIEVKELTPGDFRNWTPNGDALIYGRWVLDSDYQAIDSGIAVTCTHMPTMDKFTEDEAGTMLSDYAFRHFNNAGLIESFPEGSFDTSKLTTVGSAVFQSFNYNGKLSTVPSGSFCFPLVTSVGDNFMASFNELGDIYYLPNDTFDTRSIVTTGSNYLQWFNGMIATGSRNPMTGQTTYSYNDGALGKSLNSSPLFINNTSSTVLAVYRGDSREWTSISSGQKLGFNNDPTYIAERQPST